MARGVDGRAIFSDDRDREGFLQTLNRVESEAGARNIAYCLMGNHFHLAVKVGDVPLSSVMQRALTPYALGFNRRLERTGHLFEARYKANLCVDDSYLYRLIRYIHMNPVRAGLVSDPLQWPWSSSRSHDPGPLDLVGFDPWPKAEELDLDLTRGVAAERPGLETLCAQAAAAMGVSAGEIRSKHRTRRVIKARRELTRVAIMNGYSLTSIGAWLETTVTSVARYRDKALNR